MPPNGLGKPAGTKPDHVRTRSIRGPICSPAEAVAVVVALGCALVLWMVADWAVEDHGVALMIAGLASVTIIALLAPGASRIRRR